jgi:hypothetical protein
MDETDFGRLLLLKERYLRLKRANENSISESTFF